MASPTFTDIEQRSEKLLLRSRVLPVVLGAERLITVAYNFTIETHLPSPIQFPDFTVEPGAWNEY